MGNLECAQQALVEQLMRFQTSNVFTIQENPAAAWRKCACNQVKVGGFPSTVGANQPGDRALLNLQRHIQHSLDTAKVFGQVCCSDHCAQLRPS